jgi:hypothetical protein
VEYFFCPVHIGNHLSQDRCWQQLATSIFSLHVNLRLDFKRCYTLEFVFLSLHTNSKIGLKVTRMHIVHTHQYSSHIIILIYEKTSLHILNILVEYFGLVKV